MHGLLDVPSEGIEEVRDGSHDYGVVSGVIIIGVAALRGNKDIKGRGREAIGRLFIFLIVIVVAIKNVYGLDCVRGVVISDVKAEKRHEDGGIHFVGIRMVT